jgi:protein gp37
MTTTKIEWTRGKDGTPGKSWNPVRGCSLVSPGCTNCYAMRQAHRFSGKGQPYEGLTKLTSHGPVWTGDVRLVPEVLDELRQWSKPCRIFVNSMSDLFHESVPDSFMVKVWQSMCENNRHVYMILTKRPDRMLAWCSRFKNLTQPSNPPQHIWLGVSVEDQKSADERIPLLLQVSAAIRWVSAEPLLGPIDFTNLGEPKRYGAHGWSAIWPNNPLRPCLDWVVVGGESGPRARPLNPVWVRSIRDQCQAASVSFFFKQWGDFSPTVRPPSSKHWDAHVFDQSNVVVRVGKKAAGRLLDGRTWDEYPGNHAA